MSTTDEAIQAVRDAILAFQAKHNKSTRQTANLAGLHWNTLYGFEDDDWMPKTSTMKRVERMMREYPKGENYE